MVVLPNGHELTNLCYTLGLQLIFFNNGKKRIPTDFMCKRVLISANKGVIGVADI